MEVNTSLNKYFEIIGLLYTYAHPDLDDKGIWDKVAKEYHISADELSRKIGSIPTKYCSAFQKSVSISNQEDFSFFFSDEDDAFVLLLQIVCATHPQWFEGADPKITNEEVSTAFADILSDESNRKMVIPPSEYYRAFGVYGISSFNLLENGIVLTIAKRKNSKVISTYPR